MGWAVRDAQVNVLLESLAIGAGFAVVLIGLVIWGKLPHVYYYLLFLNQDLTATTTRSANNGGATQNEI